MARRGDGLYRRGDSWWLNFIHDGQRHQVRLGRAISKTAARELASVKRAEILKGVAGIGRKNADIAFDKAAELFSKWAETNRRPGTAAFYAHAIKKLGDSFSGKNLSQITTWVVEKHKRKRVAEAGPIAANRELATLRAIFHRCQGWKKYEGEIPVRPERKGGVALLREPAGRLRYLEPDEEKRLLEAAKEPLRTIIIVGIYTGLRIASEALTLRWIDVDFRRKLVTVQAAYAKSGKRRSVPLNTTARAALLELKKTADGEFVFLGRKGCRLVSPRTAFETACRNAKLDGVSPHVLRHTFASRLAMAGVDLRTIQELGGWETLSLVQRYAHLSPSHKAAAIESIVQNSTTLSTTPENQPRSETA